MTDPLRVLLEIGPKGKRIVASGMDWPGLERWGRTEDEAVDKLLTYVPRYAPVAERVGLRVEFEQAVTPRILERTPGNTSTDWWGIAHVPSVIEGDPLASRRARAADRHHARDVGRSSTTRRTRPTRRSPMVRVAAGASGTR